LKDLRKLNLTRFLLHPLLLAAPVALIIIYFLPGSTGRYEVNQVSKELVPIRDASLFVNDIDRDGNSDRTYFYTNTSGKAAFFIKLNNGTVLDQWNLDGDYISARNYNVLDVDNDGFDDVVALYFRNDSLFLTLIKPMHTAKNGNKEIFIDHLKISEFGDDFSFDQVRANDISGDGLPEVLFTITAGFSLYPRNAYAYNQAMDTLFRSEYLGVQLHLGDTDLTADLDGDGKMELILSNYAQGNMKPPFSTPLHDNASWILILDDQLNFWTEPVGFPAIFSSICSHILSSGEEKRVLFVINSRSNNSLKSQLHLFDPVQRKIVKSENSDFLVNNSLLLSLSTPQYAVVQNQYGDLFHITGELEPTPAGSIENAVIPYIAQADLNNDGQKEVIYHDKNYSGFWIYATSFGQPLYVPLPEGNTHRFKALMPLTIKGKPTGFAIHIDDFLYSFSFGKDYFYLLRWLYFLLIYLTIAGIYHISLKIYRRQVSLLYEKDRQIAELKLSSIRNQLDPHFTFNTFTAIASAIYKEDNKTAYKYFSRFSRLMRASMLYSDKIMRSLEEELSFTSQYLDLEKFRYRDKFEFEIDVDEEVELTVAVPRLIIQAFADAAVTNGLMHREVGGMLSIVVREAADDLVIKVTDNGVGIEKSKELNKAKAFKSVKMITDFIALINDMNTKKISVEMYDVKEQETVAGTEVLIKIPFGIRYSPDEKARRTGF